MRLLLTMALIGAATAVQCSPALADGFERERGRKVYRYVKEARAPLPTSCRAPVSDVGSPRPGEGWARASAITSWRVRVKADHGEQFTDFTKARHVKWNCFPAMGATRCRVTANPCTAETRG